MDRYKKQKLVPEIGTQGQSQLEKAHVTIIGCGGLGCIVAPYLAGAGVGHITLIDPDHIALDNLHRQIFYTEKNIGKSKAEILAKHLKALNSDISIDFKNQKITPSNISQHVNKQTLVIECTDNLSTKYLINDYCAIHKISMIYGSLGQTEGQFAVFHNQSDSDCHLRDIYPKPLHSVETCNQTGVLNTIAGIIGIFQANEAIKIITNRNRALKNKLIIYDAIHSKQLSIQLKKNYTKRLEIITDSEITFDSMIQHLDQYKLISLIPLHEQSTLAFNFESMHVSEALEYNWNNLSEKIVFLCAHGNTSQLVAQELRQRYENDLFLSLKKGIQSIQ